MQKKMKLDPLDLIKKVSKGSLSTEAKVLLINLIYKIDWYKRKPSIRWNQKKSTQWGLSRYKVEKATKELKASKILSFKRIKTEYEKYTLWCLDFSHLDIQINDVDIQINDVDIQINDVDIQNSDADIQNSDADIQNSDADIQINDVDIQNSDTEDQGTYTNLISNLISNLTSYSSLTGLSKSLLEKKGEREREEEFLLKHIKQNYELSDSELLQDDFHYHLESSNEILIRLAPEVYHDQDQFIKTLLDSKLDLDFLLEMILIGLYEANDKNQIKRKRIEL